jgi:hypothetical protein
MENGAIPPFNKVSCAPKNKLHLHQGVCMIIMSIKNKINEYNSKSNFLEKLFIFKKTTEPKVNVWFWELIH